MEPADLERAVPNPDRKKTKKQIAAVRRELGQLKQAYGELALRGSDQNAAERQRIQAKVAELEQQLEPFRREQKTLPNHVPVGELPGSGAAAQLERERKILVDQIKMVGYRAETELAALVAPLLGNHHGDEARSFLRQVFQLPADLHPEPEAGLLRVRVHGMANHCSNRALDQLCTILNAYETHYPGTELRLVLDPPSSQQ